ncbi:7952_t:CDS:2 [Acaulospora morrowiae]|uniref:7952_t:CDS:1 n=1 Tax=Acaulospora morrowiae TaxID=94023 RepID=A0A9N8ZQ01_9GLOM|nr:7952_t:CDS:2 [Acaulospora morrowiae]
MTEYEEDIIPVINPDPPLDSFKIHSTGKSSPKLFENFTGSLTRLGHSLLSSNSIKREDDVYIDIAEKVAIENDISIISCSPDNEYVASWCREDGILAVWPITKGRIGGRLSPSFAVKTPFDKTNVDGSKVYLSVSEEGKYVVISRMKIIDGEEEETPNLEIIPNVESEKLAGKSLDITPHSSFVVYSTAPHLPQDPKLNDLEILGPLIFVHHSRLVCFTKRDMHIFSTKSWKIINSIRISQLIRSTPGYNHDKNQFLADVYDILIDNLRYDSLLWPEKDQGLSVWNLDGLLKQWFYLESKSVSQSDNLYAISRDGSLVARFHERSGYPHGVLTIFHTPTALTISDIDVPKTVFHIAFLHKCDRMIVCSYENSSGKYVRVQLYCCWSGLLVKEATYPDIDVENLFLFNGDTFIQAKANELAVVPLFQHGTPKKVERLSLITECQPTEDGLLISTMLDPQSTCWGQIHDSEGNELCRFKFEPWRSYKAPHMFITWLDETRFLMAGKDSIQIYRIKPRGSLLKTELQYIWTVPVTRNSDIKFLSLETIQDKDGLDCYYLLVQLTDQHDVRIPLPSKEDKLSCKIVSDACMAVHFLRLQFGEESEYLNHLGIKEQLHKLIESAVEKYPSAFSKITTGNGETIYPMEDFILLSWDKVVRDILDSNQYIPLFHNEEQSESALSLLVELQKSELVERMISYIIKNLHQRYNPMRAKFANSSVESFKMRLQQPGFAWTIGKVLLDLYKYYPDKGARVLRECSYFTTSLETPVRILQTNLGKPFTGEERSFLPELAAVTRKAQLPKELMKAYDGRKKFADWLRSTFSRPSEIRKDDKNSPKYLCEKGIGAYGSSTFIESEKKFLINRESHMYRKQLRKQRLDNLQKTHPAKLCVVPLPDFCVYPTIPENYDDTTYQRMKKFWNWYIAPSQMSPFADIAINGPRELFGEVAMEAIIKFKWEKFAKAYFLNSFILYLTYAILFCVTVSIDYDLVLDTSKKVETWKNTLFIIVTVISFVFLLQEFRQMVGRWKIYFSSFFNYIDLASYGLPLATSLMVIAVKSDPPAWLKSFAVLMVWFNALLMSRAFAGPGKFIAILIEIGKKIITLIMTLAVIVIGFANALFVLLRNVDPNDIVNTYNGSISNSSGGVVGNLTIQQDIRSDTNQWTRFDSALFATYKFLGIGWESVTNIEPTWSLNLMMLLFSFVTVIIILNVLIGLITEVFVGSLQVGRQAWLRQRAELIAELELFSLTPKDRQKSDWFPHLVYYEAHLDSINRWQRKLYQEERGDLDVDFVRSELKTVKDDLEDELKELKGMVGHIKIAMGIGKMPSDGDTVGGAKFRSERDGNITLH